MWIWKIQKKFDKVLPQCNLYIISNNTQNNYIVLNINSLIVNSFFKKN